MDGSNNPHTFRFAPTPSGYLHIGNACSFMLTWVFARSTGSAILLRIDDLDNGRTRKSYIEDIFKTIEYIGIDYDKGPSGIQDFKVNWSQNLRIELYNKFLDELLETGKIYPCSLSRSDIKKFSKKASYPAFARERKLSASNEIFAWRLITPEGEESEFVDWNGQIHRVILFDKMGDFIVKKKNGMPAYQISSLVDDLFFGVDRIVRGEDLIVSTAAQLYLAKTIHKDAFLKSTFYHHPLILGSTGKKISKSVSTSSKNSLKYVTDIPVKLILETVAGWLGFSALDKLRARESGRILLELYTDKYFQNHLSL